MSDHAKNLREIAPQLDMIRAMALLGTARYVDRLERNLEWMQENWRESEFRFACRVNPSAPTKAMARSADKFVSAKIAAWDDAEDTCSDPYHGISCSDPYHGISCSDPDEEEENSGTVNGTV